MESARSPEKVSTRKKFFYLLLAIFILATLVTTFFGKKGFLDIQRSKKRLQELQTEIEQLTAQKEKLEYEIKKLETDPEALEKEAREKLWLIKPDEKVIVREKK
ncbi:MAG: septum formation initiator family protein [Candidatus Saccharicenans sp.]|nr:septum formation initiator family protein [Candidatus Saccharicenans sp.]